MKACYAIALMGILALETKALATPWKLETVRDKMTDRASLMLSVVGSMTLGRSKGEPAILTIKCDDKGKDAVAFAVFGGPVGVNGAQVVYRFDSAPPVTTKWVIADPTSAVLTDGKAAATFGRSALNARHLTIRIGGIGFGTSDSEFDLDSGEGIAAAFPCLLKATPKTARRK